MTLALRLGQMVGVDPLHFVRVHRADADADAEERTEYDTVRHCGFNEVDSCANGVDDRPVQATDLARARRGPVVALAGRVRLPAVVAFALAVAGCSDRPLYYPSPPDLAPPGDTVTRACLTFVSCGLDLVYPEGSSLLQCLATWQGIDRSDVQVKERIDAAALACLAVAGGDCARAAACLNGGQQPQKCNPPNGKGESTCAGAVLQFCSTGKLTRTFDCASVGLLCLGDAIATCGFGPCTYLGGSFCVDNRLATCSGGMLALQTDCTIYGGTCVFDGIATAACHGTGTPCVSSSSPACQGERAISCVGGGTEIIDCPAAGQRCVQGICVSTDSCTVDPTCAGSVLTFCAASGQISIDCALLGFAGCDASNGGRCTR